MHRSVRHGFVSFASIAAVMALAASGCNCRPPTTGSALGVLGVVWQDEAQAQQINRDATYNFGTALTGERIRLQLVIRNTGAGNISLISLESTEGSPVFIGDGEGTNEPFIVNFKPGDTIAPTAEKRFDMFFVPRGGSNYQAKLKLVADGTRVEDTDAIITLVAKGEGTSCDLPTEIDFGDVPVGERFQYKWSFNNTASVDGTVFIGEPSGGDASSFGLNAMSPRGQSPITAKSQLEVVYEFAPTELREYASTVTMKGPGECPEATIAIKGKGVDSVLSWTPSNLDFGTVAPGVDAKREVTFTNTSKVPITLTDVRTMLPDFAWDSGAGDPTKFTVPGGGVPTKMTVLCRPEGLGARNSTLEFATGMMKNPKGIINLVCRGGGPAIKVTPRPTVAFGRIAYFPNNTTYQAVRRVSIQNLGTKPGPMDTSANLFLGSVAMDGTPGQLPFIALEATNPNTDVMNGELEVNFATAYDPVVGIEAGSARNYVDMIVTIKPKTAGMKAAKLTIFSNDPQEPVIEVAITADAQELPPCNLSVTPTNLNFGLVTPPGFKDLPVTITNLGQNANDLCYLSGIDLQAGTDPAFSIVGGSIVEKELQPREVFNVVVRVTPPTNSNTMTTSTLTGALHFNISSPTTPEKTVPISATIGPSCLTIAPDVLDFGTVKKGCNSAAQTFSIYNTCATPVLVTGFSMQAAAGQPLNGPDCTAGTPGFNSTTMRCDEFLFQMTPSVGSGITINPNNSMPVTFSAKYKPIDIGSDTGAIAINAIQSGQNVTYLVSLTGTGDNNGTQVDTYIQDLKPLADVMVIVDDSCSMEDKQNAMGANFNSFIQYAINTNTDFQIGVTTTSMSECVPIIGCLGGQDGKLIGDANNPKILKPNTPQLASKFNSKVRVGTNGGTEMGFSPAVSGLTPPIINNENAGFLRYDANLAIVVVTDAGDQSPDPFSTYLNKLKNIKGYNRANYFTFNVIGPFNVNTGSCVVDDYTNTATYAQMVSQTNGVQYEICATDWAMKLQDLGKTAFGYHTSFFLNYEPSFATGSLPLEVKINGMVVAMGQGWTYNPMTQSIEFTEAAAPGPADTLTITYTRACL